MNKQDKTGVQQPAVDSSAAYALLLDDLLALRSDLVALENDSVDMLQQVHAHHRAGAINLVHYMALRRRDMRPLQEKLAAVGLTSLGCAESHVLSSLHAMIALLQHALQLHQADDEAHRINKTSLGAELLHSNAVNLLGKSPAARQVRILVTLPAVAADDYKLIKDMLTNGMNCARINCAHDGPEVWLRIIEKIKKACRETGCHCRILMDLGGPKLRTGEIALAPAVLKWQPQRDALGQVVAAARIWLYPEADHLSCPSGYTYFPIRGNWLAHATTHDQIEFTDARGAHRIVKLTGQVGDGFWAESTQTTYLIPGLELHLLRTSTSGHPRKEGKAGAVGSLPQQPESIHLQRGDSLMLTSKPIPGFPAEYDNRGHLLRPATISCSLPEVFPMVKAGERIFLMTDALAASFVVSVLMNW